ncbi:MAG: phosphatidylinositol-specific phospholipase C/glycerophosphodiester phosphodiesterase family protein [Bacteroidaceae bacterium]|nr:phosphatidylinositol-specific phospholipase C/glycerophosphodiester phosphodiesterase family protein [Bacteroidaceae bacterium]
MNYRRLPLSLLLIFMLSTLPVAGKRPLIHSHNDYDQACPFWGAYEAHAASIEADIWLVDGNLFVAHDKKDIRPERTLEAIYLQPIRQVVEQHGGSAYANGTSFQLLVDLKTGRETLDALVRLIEEKGYRRCFDTAENPAAIMLTITGDKVKPEDFGAYPSYVFFDGRIEATYTPEQLRRVPLISEYRGLYTKWKGIGKMSKEDQQKIRRDVEKAHRQGCKFRVWGFPDNKNAWRMTRRLGIDYINTDHPEKAG